MLVCCLFPHPRSQGTCGLVAMTSASHAEGRQFDPGQVYLLPTKETDNKLYGVGMAIRDLGALFLGFDFGFLE